MEIDWARMTVTLRARYYLKAVSKSIRSKIEDLCPEQERDR